MLIIMLYIFSFVPIWKSCDDFNGVHNGVFIAQNSASGPERWRYGAVQLGTDQAAAPGESSPSGLKRSNLYKCGQKIV